MLVTLLDVETTGLDPNTHEVIEVAALLYDTDTQCVLQQVSTLLPFKENPAEHINGISRWSARKVCENLKRTALASIANMVYGPHYATAFNSEFDRGFIQVNLPGLLPPESETPWFDSMLLPWQHHKTQPSLIDLCIAYHIPVVSAHRALDDCRLLAALLDKLPDVDEAIAYALKPRVIVKALVSYDDRQIAKDAGFAWDRLVPKAWAKRVVRGEEMDLPFEIVEVE